MRVARFENPVEFEKAAGAWLAREPRRNNLILSVLRRTVESGDQGRGWLVSSDNGAELALFQTPPHPVTASLGSIDAAEYAAESLPSDLPGITAPSEVCDAFVRRWAQRASCKTELHVEMTFYALDRVEPFSTPAGGLRRANLDDLNDLLPLGIAAARDMNLRPEEQDPEEVEKRLRRNIGANRQFLWIDGESIRAIASYAASMAGSMKDGGARIGLVYTRPEFRAQGYGTAITGSLAQLLLDQGQAWVSLFADNLNPVSNGIYRRLGFRPELVYRTWLFS